MPKSLAFIAALFLILPKANSQDQESNLLELPKDVYLNSKHWLSTLKRENTWAITSGGAALALGVMANDLQIQQWAQTSSAVKDNLNGPSELFGNPVYMGGLSLGANLIAIALDNQHLHELSNQALQSVLFGGAAALGLKLIFHRERPEEQITLDPYQFKGPSLASENLSFPSGHTTIAFSFAASISAYYGDQWFIAVPLYTYATLTAWQRVYDLKHWPSDVVGGAILGIIVGRTIHKWQEGSRLKLKTSLNSFGQTLVGVQLDID